MKIDINKVIVPLPKDEFEAIRQLSKSQGDLITALSLLNCILINNDPNSIDFHVERITNFLIQFEKSE